MIIIGADESGTGALAGPFTVCAVAVYENDQGLLRRIGVMDSKKLTDVQRRSMFDEIIDIVLVGHCVFGTVEMLEKHGLSRVWTMAMGLAIGRIAATTQAGQVVIDGSPRRDLTKLLRAKGLEPKFMPKADAKVPAVGAASIIAKTLRNDAMLELHGKFPEYGWNTNYGYGTPDHLKALDKLGKCVQHRPWKNLSDVPLSTQKEKT